MNCSICGDRIETTGNDADPINDGRCCDNCDMTVVLSARLNQCAYTALISGDSFILGLADRNERGYLNIEPDITYPNYDVAEQEAQRRNEVMGINPYEAIRIVASSMSRK